MAEADFLIPGLAPGRYGFAIVNVDGYGVAVAAVFSAAAGAGSVDDGRVLSEAAVGGRP